MTLIKEIHSDCNRFKCEINKHPTGDLISVELYEHDKENGKYYEISAANSYAFDMERAEKLAKEKLDLFTKDKQ